MLNMEVEFFQRKSIKLRTYGTADSNLKDTVTGDGGAEQFFTTLPTVFFQRC